MVVSDILSLLVILVALGIAVAIGWWLFRMVFWLVIYFIGEAGAAWRGDNRRTGL